MDLLRVAKNPHAIAAIANILWRLSSSDLLTFVLPHVLFGLSTAVCSDLWEDIPPGGKHLTQPSSWSAITKHLLRTMTWNWLNLVLFNLSNQRLPDAIAEDKLNKPYRPIPSGLLSPDTARRTLLYGIPTIILTSYLLLGAYEESVILIVLTWMYNDLRGGDENFVLRNLIVSIAFGVYSHASSRIMRGVVCITTPPRGSSYSPALNFAGQRWITLITLVVFTTLQTQDFQDVEGDKHRNRQTTMLVLGMRTSRWCTALLILSWSMILPYMVGIRNIHMIPIITIGLGFYTAWRLLHLTDRQADKTSYKVWALWMMASYSLPIAAGYA